MSLYFLSIFFIRSFKFLMVFLHTLLVVFHCWNFSASFQVVEMILHSGMLTLAYITSDHCNCLLPLLPLFPVFSHNLLSELLRSRCMVPTWPQTHFFPNTSPNNEGNKSAIRIAIHYLIWPKEYYGTFKTVNKMEISNRWSSFNVTFALIAG